YERGAMSKGRFGEEIEAGENLSGYSPVPGIPKKLHFGRVVRILIGRSLTHARLHWLLPRRRLLRLFRHAVVFQTEPERPLRWSRRRLRSLNLPALHSPARRGARLFLLSGPLGTKGILLRQHVLGCHAAFQLSIRRAKKNYLGR